MNMGERTSDQVTVVSTGIVLMRPNMSTTQKSSSVVSSPNDNESTLSIGRSGAIVKDISFWDGTRNRTRAVVRRNVLVLLLFYLPLIGFFWGSFYLAKYLAVPPPKPYMRWVPRKNDSAIFYSVVTGFTFLLCGVTLMTIYKHRKSPVILSKLPSFIAHVSFCLLVIPPLAYITNMLTVYYSPRNNYVRFLQALELMVVGQVWAALSNRMALMYLLLAEGICNPSYKMFFVKSIIMSFVFQVIPYIVAMTVSFPKYTEIIRWAVVSYALLTLIEMSWYTVKMRGGFVKLFVDYENVVRMMIMQAVVLVLSMCMVQIESKGLAFYRFTTSMVLVWQLVFEMFGALVWNEITGAFGYDELGVSENTLIGQAYDLIDPRGRLDLLLQDKELYPILLAMAGRRHMDENFRFMKDVRQLKQMVGTKANSLTVRAGDNDNEKVSRLTLQVVDNYIMPGAAHTVNLPSRILKPLREKRKPMAVESSVAVDQVEVDIHKLLWMAYAETAILVHQSNVLGKFSKNPIVGDILKCRVDKLTALCGTDAKLVKPPQTTDVLHIDDESTTNVQILPLAPQARCPSFNR